MNKIGIYAILAAGTVFWCVNVSGERTDDYSSYSTDYTEEYLMSHHIKGEGKTVTKKVDLSPEISQINYYWPVDIFYEAGKHSQVIITGPENLLSHIECEEKGVSLEFKVVNIVRSISLEGVKITFTLPELEKIALNSPCNFYANRISTPTMSLKSLGPGNIFIKSIDSEYMKIQTSGSGDLIIDDAKGVKMILDAQGSGDISVKKTNLTSMACCGNGSGDILIGDLNTTKASLTLNGAGDVRVKNCKTSVLTAILNGTGDITVEGTSESTSAIINGMGDINLLRLKSDKIKKKVNSYYDEINVGDILE